ncbi:MAG: sulfotransferase [Acidimicrobiia bacterium]|nr:sulfotransferase [Acidimicrobiia bacterium]MDH4306497.1 sulfotransferase [Acidimicrobiia bacterium]
MAGLTELARDKLSVGTRHKIALWRVKARMAFPTKGMLPNVLVIGAQRAGTSSLYRYLGSHPQVVASIRKEVEYFSTRMSMGERWYRAHFPLVSRPEVTFEATPDYMLHPLAAKRAATRIPDLRAVALLRDPVTRALSQYGHQRRLGKEPLEFLDALKAEPDRIRGDLARFDDDPDHPGVAVRIHGYVERGRYAQQLQRWFDTLGRERVHVIRTEDLWADPHATYGALLDFLGLDEVFPQAFSNYSYTPQVGGERAGMTPEAEAFLREALADEISRVSELLGRDLGW